ncbi:MgtC/SapB family protein [Parasphingopyxis marina]|uniref:Protein MgtC n=1 Tax=Parasphingopyxis marina TaxID=2761622 RepID=A0A842I342_9SPHN|nr:MgtC/SapB family protein [Parasphingopyxis marina]MBC2778334.1 MgtC/SapB family protein [Parasphingopyxis marina]
MDWLPGNAETAETLLEISMRLGIAVLLCGILGLERERKERPAGLRTYMMVGLAAALFTVITVEMSLGLSDEQSGIRSDPIRIIEAVTAGVAFLAAGTIIIRRGDVSGLTTGAGMWMSGAIGVACGAGYYAVASVATVLALVIFVIVRLFENRLPKKE